MKDFRPRLKGNKLVAFNNLFKKETRVLVIGDLHEPFCLDEYLDHCKHIYAKHNCNKIVMIGDLIDSHGWSYHEQDPDGMSAGHELSLAIKRIARWYKAFPKADVLIGNHDRLASRKAFSGGIPSAWIKGYNDVLNTPNWKWHDRLVIDGVQYIHGEAGTARTKCRADMMSTSTRAFTHTMFIRSTMLDKTLKYLAHKLAVVLIMKNMHLLMQRLEKNQRLDVL